MRYKIICHKLIYYLGFIPYVGGALAFSSVGKEIMERGESEASLFLFILSAVVSMLAYLHLTRFIYGSIDTQNHTFVFGNLMFKQEVPVHSVKRIGHYLFYKNCYKIEINGRWFYIINHNKEEGLFLDSSST